MAKPKAGATLLRSLVSKLEKTEAFILSQSVMQKLFFYGAQNF